MLNFPGFKVATAGCCKVVKMGLCAPNSPLCPNKHEYMFWDGYHPTEALNEIGARRAYKAQDPNDVYPFDISRLLACNNHSSHAPAPNDRIR